MLPKTERLNRTQVEAVLASGVGKKFSSRYFFIVVLSAPSPRFAVVVSKKVAVTAVERNTLRRRAYTALGEIIKQTKTAAPFHMVFIAKKEAKNIEFAELKEDLSKLLKVSVLI